MKFRISRLFVSLLLLVTFMVSCAEPMPLFADGENMVVAQMPSVVSITESEIPISAMNETTEGWMRNYGGSGWDYFNSLVLTSDGGYVTVGSSNSTDGDLPGNRGDRDFVIVKSDSVGNKQWMRNYGGSGIDDFCSLVQTSDGGYAAAGYSNSSGGDLPGNKGGDDFVIAKFDPAGNKQWIKNYGGSDGDMLFSLVQTSDGGYAVAGESWSSDGDLLDNRGEKDFVIAKFDSAGNNLWKWNYGGICFDFFNSLVQTSDGGYAATGSSGSSGGDLPGNKGSEDFAIAKFDSEGNKQWIRNYGGSSYDEFFSLVQSSDGGYAAAGYSYSSGGDLPGEKEGADFVLAKFNADGDKQWIKSFNMGGDDCFNSLVQISDGDYVVAGRSYPIDGNPGEKGESDFVIAKFDSVGNKRWMRSYGGSAFDEFNSLVQTSDSGFAATGSSESSDGNLPGNKGDADGVIAKFDSNGMIHDVRYASVAKIAGRQYTGKRVAPSIKVTMSNNILKKRVDYTATYGENKKIGKGMITIIGIGKYTGTKILTFHIVPKKLSALSVRVGKNRVRVTWKKSSKAQKVSGYQVQYRVANGKKWITKKIQAKTSALTIKKLKSGKKYQIRIRAYKKVSRAIYYGPWSKVKTTEVDSF
jgi:hypothetical protein